MKAWGKGPKRTQLNLTIFGGYLEMGDGLSSESVVGEGIDREGLRLGP